MKGRFRLIPLLLVCCAAGTALGSLSTAHLIYEQNPKHEELRRAAVTPARTPSTTGTSLTQEIGAQGVPAEAGRVIDWDYLRDINPDTIGWIYVPDTPIDYPVVQAPRDDEGKYLRTTFDGEVSWPNNEGAIYLDASCADLGFSSAAPLLFGHYQLNGSMFSSLSSSYRKDELASHTSVFIYSPDTVYQIELFAGNVVDASNEKVQTSFASPEELDEWMRMKVDESEAVLDAPEHVDQLWTLCTCSYGIWEDQRTLVYGRCTARYPAPTEGAIA